MKFNHLLLTFIGCLLAQFLIAQNISIGVSTGIGSTRFEFENRTEALYMPYGFHVEYAATKNVSGLLELRTYAVQPSFVDRDASQTVVYSEKYGDSALRLAVQGGLPLSPSIKPILNLGLDYYFGNQVTTNYPLTPNSETIYEYASNIGITGGLGVKVRLGGFNFFIKRQHSGVKKTIKEANNLVPNEFRAKYRDNIIGLEFEF